MKIVLSHAFATCVSHFRFFDVNSRGGVGRYKTRMHKFQFLLKHLQIKTEAAKNRMNRWTEMLWLTFSQLLLFGSLNLFQAYSVVQSSHVAVTTARLLGLEIDNGVKKIYNGDRRSTVSSLN